jgi:hypothetical protein
MARPPPAATRGRARPVTPSTGQRWADPAPVRDHLATLLQTGTFQAVGQAAHLGPMTVWEIAHGTRPTIRYGTARALLAVQPGDLRPLRVDATGSRWRLRSLVAMGHTTGRLAAALGVPGHRIEPLLRGQRATVTAALRDDITRLWDAWWDKQPPRRTPAQKAAAGKARHRAAGHNWPCPAALDEDQLDRPGYQPSARWRYGRGTGTAADDPLGKHPPPEPGASPDRARPARTTP